MTSDTCYQGTVGPTELLARWERGDSGALSELMPQVYSRLRRVASRTMAGERSDHTLDATALVHEAFLRLNGHRAPACRDTSHFIALTARLMRQILVDHGRRVRATRRGGDRRRVPLDDPPDTLTGPGEDILALEACLERLEARAPRKARVIELRYFLGLSVRETATTLGTSERTVALDSRFARAWIIAELRAGDGRET